jgi:hypothetical protein
MMCCSVLHYDLRIFIVHSPLIIFLFTVFCHLMITLYSHILICCFVVLLLILFDDYLFIHWYLGSLHFVLRWCCCDSSFIPHYSALISYHCSWCPADGIILTLLLHCHLLFHTFDVVLRYGIHFFRTMFYSPLFRLFSPIGLCWCIALLSVSTIPHLCDGVGVCWSIYYFIHLHSEFEYIRCIELMFLWSDYSFDEYCSWYIWWYVSICCLRCVKYSIVLLMFIVDAVRHLLWHLCYIVILVLWRDIRVVVIVFWCWYCYVSGAMIFIHSTVGGILLFYYSACPYPVVRCSWWYCC